MKMSRSKQANSLIGKFDMYMLVFVVRSVHCALVLSRGQKNSFTSKGDTC